MTTALCDVDTKLRVDTLRFDELSLQRGEIPFYITQQLMRDCLGKKENRQTDGQTDGARGAEAPKVVSSEGLWPGRPRRRRQ